MKDTGAKSSPSGLLPGDYASPEDAVEMLFGKRPSPAEIAELAWYQELREALREARGDAGLTQSDLGALLKVKQSEVSRLENSLGFGTRIGRLRDYLSACGASLVVKVSTKKGRVYSCGAQLESRGTAVPDGSLFTAPPQPIPDAGVVIDSVPFLDRDLPYIADAVPALDSAMADLGLDPVQAARLRRRFLERLQALRRVHGGFDPGFGSASEPLLGPGAMT